MKPNRYFIYNLFALTPFFTVNKTICHWKYFFSKTKIFHMVPQLFLYPEQNILLIFGYVVESETETSF